MTEPNRQSGENEERIIEIEIERLRPFKEHSYIVTYEDETQIRYLMYDRDNQEGTKTQYVYYKNIKSTDGSWSMMDAEILDMYQYDYESKEVKDLQKTSW